MNVYDFDHTIYRGDCTLDFWRYCVGKYPAALRVFPKVLVTAVRFFLKKDSREKFKEQFYGFLRYIPNVETEIRGFWDKNLGKCAPWYLQQKRENDLIISASPDFLISEVCMRLQVQWIASPVDVKKGKLLGPNCRGEEKVRRFFQAYPNGGIEQFYSDSVSDAPLASLAAKAFYVRKGKVFVWESAQKIAGMRSNLKKNKRFSKSGQNEEK